jgi:hypothetical protein
LTFVGDSAHLELAERLGIDIDSKQMLHALNSPFVAAESDLSARLE